MKNFSSKAFDVDLVIVMGIHSLVKMQHAQWERFIHDSDLITEGLKLINVMKTV